MSILASPHSPVRHLNVYLAVVCKLHTFQGRQQVNGHHRRQPLPVGFQLGVTVQKESHRCHPHHMMKSHRRHTSLTTMMTMMMRNQTAWWWEHKSDGWALCLGRCFHCTWREHSLHRAALRKQHIATAWHKSARSCRTQQVKADKTDGVSVYKQQLRATATFLAVLVIDWATSTTETLLCGSESLPKRDSFQNTTCGSKWNKRKNPRLWPSCISIYPKLSGFDHQSNVITKQRG